jgi:hypothetical protein
MFNFEAELEKQIEISKWVDKHLSIPFDFAKDKDKWAFSCFDIVIEHHTSIVTLSDLKLYGSALSLYRVQYEAFIRGLWLRYAATENDLSRFKRGKEPPRFQKLIESVETARNINSGLLSHIKNKQWSIFNSFTHTGSEALSRRMGSTTTGYDNYKEEEIAAGLRFSGLILLICASEMAILTDDNELINKTVSLLQNYKSK